jgi:hypothetical protein
MKKDKPMDIEMRPINEVIPYGNNPRKNDKAVKAVANSIKKFGFRQPIVVDKNGVIIVGHTRLKAAKELGIENVPVHVANLTEKQAKAYRLADNKTSELSEWDDDLLNVEKLGIDDIDMTDFGFTEPDGNDSELVELDLKAPKMAWVLVGIPTVRYSEIQEHIDRMSEIDGIFLETTFTDK